MLSKSDTAVLLLHWPHLALSSDFKYRDSINFYFPLIAHHYYWNGYAVVRR